MIVQGIKKGWDRLKEIEVTQDMIDRALEKGGDMGVLHNSIMVGEGNTGGFLGEEVVRKYLGVHSNNTYQYDLVTQDLKVEVKTKRTSSIPEKDYECSVAAYNTKQQCDMYVFVRVTYDLKKAWIIGYLPRDEFYQQARFSPVGSKEINNYLERASCYKVMAEQTKDIVELLVYNGTRENNRKNEGELQEDRCIESDDAEGV